MLAKSPLRKFTLSEDWLATLLGLYLIFVFASGSSIRTPVYGWGNFGDLLSKVLTLSNLGSILLQFLLVYFVSAIATYLSGKNIKTLLKALITIFLMAQLALLLAGNTLIKSYNLEAVIFSLVLGLLSSHLVRLPDEWRAVLSSEWYVKVGLVLLGTTIIFSDVLKAGSLGLIQAVVVVFLLYAMAASFMLATIV